MLETKNIKKLFDGVRAIDNLSIAAEKGKITSIVGPNGSGKTTLVNVLSGVLPLDDGAVVIGKERLEEIIPHKAPLYGLTRTFQNVRLFEQMTVLDNILVVLTERNLWGSIFERHQKDHLEKAEAVLQKVDLLKKKNELAKNLSYGQRKLLEIARALSMNTEIYLLDEPFAGLFPEMTKIVVTVIKELRAAGKTIILIEHNMDLIRQLSDHLIVMDSGQLLAEGEVNAVLAKKEVIEAYLGE